MLVCDGKQNLLIRCPDSYVNDPAENLIATGVNRTEPPGWTVSCGKEHANVVTAWRNPTEFQAILVCETAHE